MLGKSLGISGLIAALSVTGPTQRIRSRSRFGRYHWPAVSTSSQKTRNPADPQQSYLIARAEAKRARRAEKLTRDTRRAFRWNRAHDAVWKEIGIVTHVEAPGLTFANGGAGSLSITAHARYSLNPFHIN